MGNYVGLPNFITRTSNQPVETFDEQPYKWPPKPGENYFGPYFMMGGERFDVSQPESYLFGENTDLNFLGSQPVPFPFTPVPHGEPIQMLHSLVNIRRDSLKLIKVPIPPTEQIFKVKGPVYNLEFIIDCDASCNISIYYFATERVVDGEPVYISTNSIMNSETYKYQRGSNQMFHQTSHYIAPDSCPMENWRMPILQTENVESPIEEPPETSGRVPQSDRERRNDSLFTVFHHRNTNEQASKSCFDFFPIVIHAVVDDPNFAYLGHHSHVTYAYLDVTSDGLHVIKAFKQKQMIGGVFYLLQEIYGIENKCDYDCGDVSYLSNMSDVNCSDDDMLGTGCECIICYCEPRDTIILPCRHLCLCSACADSLRYQANNCPMCRVPFRALLQIRAMRKQMIKPLDVSSKHQPSSKDTTYHPTSCDNDDRQEESSTPKDDLPKDTVKQNKNILNNMKNSEKNAPSFNDGKSKNNEFNETASMDDLQMVPIPTFINTENCAKRADFLTSGDNNILNENNSMTMQRTVLGDLGVPVGYEAVPLIEGLNGPLIGENDHKDDGNHSEWSKALITPYFSTTSHASQNQQTSSSNNKTVIVSTESNQIDMASSSPRTCNVGKGDAIPFASEMPQLQPHHQRDKTYVISQNTHIRSTSCDDCNIKESEIPLDNSHHEDYDDSCKDNSGKKKQSSISASTTSPISKQNGSNSNNHQKHSSKSLEKINNIASDIPIGDVTSENNSAAALHQHHHRDDNGTYVKSDDDDDGGDYFKNEDIPDRNSPQNEIIDEEKEEKSLHQDNHLILVVEESGNSSGTEENAIEDSDLVAGHHHHFLRNAPFTSSGHESYESTDSNTPILQSDSSRTKKVEDKNKMGNFSNSSSATLTASLMDDNEMNDNIGVTSNDGSSLNITD